MASELQLEQPFRQTLQSGLGVTHAISLRATLENFNTTKSQGIWVFGISVNSAHLHTPLETN
jgi:hypothetical protein